MLNFTKITSYLYFFATAIQYPSNARENVINWLSADVPTVGMQNKIIFRGQKAHDFIVDDVDNDGQAELGILRSDPSHPFHLVIKEVNSTAYTFTGTTVPVDTNGDYIFFPIKNNPQFRWCTYSFINSTGIVTLYNSKLQPSGSIKVIDGNDRMDINLHYAFKEIMCANLNQDGCTDVLLRFNNGVHGWPRSLMGFDLCNKKKFLQIDFAPLIYSARIYDINSDGQDEILVGLGSAGSGSPGGLYNYDSTYFAVLNKSGQTLFKKSYGSGATMLDFEIADVDNDLHPEIIVIYYGLVRDQQEISRLEIFDDHSLKQLAPPLTSNNSVAFQHVQVTDADHDGNKDILASDGEGVMRLVQYDGDQHQLNVIKTAHCGGLALLLATDDIDQDGIDEWFFYAQGSSYIHIVNNRLEALARVAVASHRNKKFTPLPGAQPYRRYILLDGKEISEVIIEPDVIFPPPLFQFHFLGIAWRGSPFQLYTGILALLGLMGFFSTMIIRSSRPKEASALSQSRRIGVAEIDSKGILRTCNPRFLKMLDKKNSDIHHKKITQVLQDKRLAPLLVPLETFIGTRELFAIHEITLATASLQRNISVEFIRSPQHAEQIKIILIDLCESTQTERVKIWAAMALRVAHKTKTPLASVALAVQRLQKAYRKLAPEHAQDFDPLSRTALNEIDRVRDCINSFMKFAKIDEPVFIVHDLNKSLQESLDEYRRRIPESVELDVCLDKTQMPVRLDVKQFREAIFNILDNAITAVKGDGIIRVNTSLESHPLNAFGEKSHAILDISDSGIGMNEDVLKTLFQPGQSMQKYGSGMGLVISKNIVETHGGEILLASQSGVGTTVTIRLPILQQG